MHYFYYVNGHPVDEPIEYCDICKSVMTSDKERLDLTIDSNGHLKEFGEEDYVTCSLPCLLELAQRLNRGEEVEHSGIHVREKDIND